jgi:DNA-directed RNA polymerase I subunit RPA43
MAKPKNYYIKYKLSELEDYIKNPESCVKKINCEERLRFGPSIMGNFKESIMRILSRKIGKYDPKMNGVVLDFRNSKVLNIYSDVRNDSAYSMTRVQSNFYVFVPRKDAIVDGTVTHINHQSIETIISVVIYRVFNVKVTFKGCIKQNQVCENDIIKIRIKQFHFDNEIPYIEGEMIGTSFSTAGSTRKLFESDVLDSGISESSISFEQNGNSRLSSAVKIKMERESSSEPSTSAAAAAAADKQKSSKRKRAKSPVKEQPTAKKIKQESDSSDDDRATTRVNIKQEKPEDESSSSSSKPQKKAKDKKTNKKIEQASQNESNSEQPTKQKKKKKKIRDFMDDFESSMQSIINSSNIKTEIE